MANAPHTGFYTNNDSWLIIDPSTYGITDFGPGNATAGQYISISDDGFNVIGRDKSWYDMAESDLRYFTFGEDTAAQIDYTNNSQTDVWSALDALFLSQSDYYNLASNDAYDVNYGNHTYANVGDALDAIFTTNVGASTYFVGDTAPGTPSQGDAWYNTVDGRSYIWYDDGSSAQWVDNSPAVLQSISASGIEYDNAISGLVATTVQAAIDEIAFGGTSKPEAINTVYDNAMSGLPATNAQDAIDQVLAIAYEPHVVLSAYTTQVQAPDMQDEAKQVHFGDAQGTVDDPVMISSGGSVTFNQAGLYTGQIELSFSRSQNSGTARLFIRQVENGVQTMPPIAIALADNRTIIPVTSTFTRKLEAGTVMAVEIYRDGTSFDDGSLSAASGMWGDAPTAALRIVKES